MNVCIVLERSGYRVARRTDHPGKIGRKHRIAKDEAIEYMKKRYGIALKES
jgi:large subunit ribosomal protein L5